MAVKPTPTCTDPPPNSAKMYTIVDEDGVVCQRVFEDVATGKRIRTLNMKVGEDGDMQVVSEIRQDCEIYYDDQTSKRRRVEFPSGRTTLYEGPPGEEAKTGV